MDCVPSAPGVKAEEKREEREVVASRLRVSSSVTRGESGPTLERSTLGAVSLMRKAPEISRLLLAEARSPSASVMVSVRVMLRTLLEKES